MVQVMHNAVNVLKAIYLKLHTVLYFLVCKSIFQVLRIALEHRPQL